MEYIVNIENIKPDKDYSLVGEGFSVTKTSKSSFIINAINNSEYTITILEASKVDTNIISQEYYNVLPIPRPKLKWGIIENKNVKNNLKKSEILSSNNLSVDEKWLSKVNLDYQVEALEIQSMHTDYATSFKGSQISNNFLEKLASFGKENRVVIAVKVRCPDGVSRIYAEYYNISIDK